MEGIQGEGEEIDERKEFTPMTQKEFRAVLEDALREEAAMLIAEWDKLMGFVKKNKLPETLLNTALDHRLRLMRIRDGEKPQAGGEKPVDSKK